MRVIVHYAIDETTDSDTFDGTRITAQILPADPNGDHRGNVTVRDASGAKLRAKVYAKVYAIEHIYKLDDEHDVH